MLDTRWLCSRQYQLYYRLSLPICLHLCNSFNLQIKNFERFWKRASFFIFFLFIPGYLFVGWLCRWVFILVFCFSLLFNLSLWLLGLKLEAWGFFDWFKMRTRIQFTLSAHNVTTFLYCLIFFHYYYSAQCFLFCSSVDPVPASHSLLMQNANHVGSGKIFYYGILWIVWKTKHLAKIAPNCFLPLK